MTTITWGGTTLPNPTRADQTYAQAGAGALMNSAGTLLFDIIAEKRLIVLRWEDITGSEKDDIVTKATAYASASLDLTAIGYGSAQNVIPQINTLKVSPVGVTPVWTVDVTVREV